MSNTKNLANLAAALDDGTSGQVLQSTGSGGVQFADSSGSGVTVHANQTAMLDDAGSADEGSLHYENNTNKLYVKQSSGFYLLASITNASPTIDSFSENTGGAGANNLTAGGTFELTSGSNTVITINATEPDLETISYSATVTSGTATDVFSSPSFPVTNQSSNTFTLTPVTSGTGGTVTIRFDASDGTNVANVSHSFEIAFVIIDSHYTSLLMATDESAGNNKDDITDATTNHTITANGDAHAGTFSPYRHGGYSTYFDGSGDYITTGTSSGMDFGTGDFTIEAFIWMDNHTSGDILADARSTWNDAGWSLEFSSDGFQLYTSGGVRVSSSAINTLTQQWVHVAFVRSSGTIKIYVDGISRGTGYFASAINTTASTVSIGRSQDGNGGTFHGYITDFRIVSSALYTSNFTPSTERLTKITNTELLACHLPYFADGSDNDLSITLYGNTSTKPFGPYDYDEYDESINSGSVYFDDNGDYLSIADSTDWDLGTSWTLEAWAYPTNDGKGFSTRMSTNSANNMWEFFIFRTNNTWAFEGYGGNNTSGPKSTTGTYPLNSWSHVAYVYDGSNVKIYVNGILDGTHSITTSWSSSYGPYIGGNAAYGEWFAGYITNLRLVKGTAVYSGNFTPPTGPLTATGGTYPSTTNVNTSITSGHTKLLLKGADAHVIDKSQNYNLELVGTAAAVTNATNNSTISSTNAISLNGSSDYIKPNDVILPITQGVDYTIEGWFYADTITGVNPIVSQYISGNGGRFSILVENSVLKFFEGGSSRQTISVNTGTWYHFLMCRSGTTHYAFMDGTLVGSSWTSSTNIVNTNTQIGHFATTTNYYFDGFLQDIRISIGKARETSDFNVPSAPLKG